ncbi:hypothetical protein IW261DRAFT_1571759 [Armillaria novae-zelandiae]|uniref:Uncharacterized protein n=1 Tax=Armillaria novae-zelandiae TaxID=153914 RepID=A0AA39NTW5_9AGAR|nr:hypothetical protein IW261DRAFT_1571759 [Armillaria novae-zelandiae]
MEKAQKPVDNLPAIPPSPRPPTPLVSETKFGDPYKFRHEISEAIRPLLLADGGRAVPSDILPVIEKVHPLLLAHVKDLKERKKRSDCLDVLLRQTCYTLACQTPPRHHKMKEWSVWVPIAEEYDVLGPENVIGETEMFDATQRYHSRKEQYAQYKAAWHELDHTYKESVKIRNKIIAAHEAAKCTKEAAELKAKQDMEAEKKKVLAIASQSKTSPSKGASETKVQPSARVIKDGQFRVQTQESMSQTKSPTTLKRPLQTEPESTSKFPCLEGENSRQIRLAPLDTDDSSTFPIPFSFDPVVLSHALDLGPSQCVMPASPPALGRRAIETSTLWVLVHAAAMHTGAAARGSNSAISHQISQIQHCQSLVLSLSQIVTSEMRNMEILVSNLIGSLRSICRDGTYGDALPILENLVQAHPLLQRLIDEGLLRLKDPDVSPAFNWHGPTGDNTSSSALTSPNASTPDTNEGASSGSQESKDNAMDDEKGPLSPPSSPRAALTLLPPDERYQPRLPSLKNSPASTTILCLSVIASGGQGAGQTQPLDVIGVYSPASVMIGSTFQLDFFDAGYPHYPLLRHFNIINVGLDFFHDILPLSTTTASITSNTSETGTIAPVSTHYYDFRRIEGSVPQPDLPGYSPPSSRPAVNSADNDVFRT